MGRFVNTVTGVTFSVDDSKDERYQVDGFEAATDESSSKSTSKRASSSKSTK